jgi:hypothetical protein
VVIYIQLNDCEEKIIKELKPLCIDFKVDIEEQSQLNHEYHDRVDIYKIKIKDRYAIMICIISIETNTWSKQPRNYFITDVYLYNNPENRNNAYEKYLNSTNKI